MSRVLSAAIIVVSVLCACGGSRSTLPAIPNAGPLSKAKLSPAVTAAAAGGDIVAIDAGGGAAGSFAADQDFVSAGTQTYAVKNAINTSAVTNPAPQAVYQCEREGKTVSYTIPGLTAGAAYSVKLSFAELWWTSAGKRIFNVSINGTQVLANFDVFAATQAEFKAISESFPANASSSGTIAITLTAVTDLAAIDAIEIAPASGTPTASPTSPPAGGTSIDAGGPASGNFVADEDSVGQTSTATVTNAIATSAISNPAPQIVYQSERYGQTFSYVVPGFTAGASYAVRLDFSENYWSGAGSRIFSVKINGAPALTNFDIYATAGGKYKAVAESFTTSADSSGKITIAFSTAVDNAKVDGLEIVPNNGTGPTPTPTTTPTTAPSAVFNDYTTFGYDNQRDVYNANSTAFTPASLAGLHLAWQASLGDYNTQTQPVLATEIAGHAGVLFVGGGSGNVYAYDALTGSQLWKQATGQETYTCENNNTIYFGVGGTVAYDPSSRSLYVVGNSNPNPNAVATNSLYHLDGASGAVLNQVNFAPSGGVSSLDFSHTAVTLGGNGLAYVGTGATCDISSWRGRVVAVSVPTMSIANTFFTVWDPNNSRGAGAQPWGGGGIWGWGGVSLDFNGNVVTGVGNTDNGSTTHGSIKSPFAASPAENSGYGETLLQLTSSVSSVENFNHPIPSSAYSGDSLDLDLQGTPVVFRPNGTGCDPMTALQAKSGTIYLYDETRIGAGPVAQYQLAPSTYSDGFLGGPAYSPATGLLYVAVSSSNESLYPPGMIAINPGCGSPSVTWHAAFGPDSYSPGSLDSPGAPRSVPAVSAGGVVFVGTICTPSGNSCGATAAGSAARSPQGATRKPLICCAPPGTGGGAVWALDASSGTVLNGGNPLIITSGPLRVPPTIDGNWIFVLDNAGNLYALTLNPNYAAISTIGRSVDARMLKRWEGRPGTP